MIFDAIILFTSALFGGLLVIRVKDPDKIHIKDLLVFAGAFLFSITILHILPELFHTEVDSAKIGLLVLLGFYFQQVLEYFTNGVEHGHMHVHHHGDHHSKSSGFSLMLALCIHSFLEGTILAQPDMDHHGHGEETLLIGIVLHKIPAALALMTVLSCQFKERKTQLMFLVIFAIASPLGVMTGHLIEPMGWLGFEGTTMLFAFVAGNFLHIATTIFIESSPDHKWNSKKLFISILGAVTAALIEMFF